MSVESELTQDEAALLYTVTMHGSAAYPIQKIGSGWHWRKWRGVKGAPTVFKAKRDAVALFERWMEIKRDAWREIRRTYPNAIMHAYGFRTGEEN